MEKPAKKLDYIGVYRDDKILKALSLEIKREALKLKAPLYIMEVCGGHTHTLMKYALKSLIESKNLHFIHGPGCPVCIMPKSRISHAYALSLNKDVILCTLGDMIKVPGLKGSLSDARAQGADVRFVYSPLDCLKIAKENKDKKIVYFAIGFETTTPMSAALLEQAIKQDITNLYFHINHVLVPPPLKLILSDPLCKVNALLAPSHVSVITGAKIYEELARDFKIPIVVSGFEPVDMLHSTLMLVKQKLEDRYEVEIEYSRLTDKEGNLKAQKMMDKYFELRASFEWRGLGEIADSALKLKDEYARFDAEKVWDLSHIKAKESKACLCGEILKGKASPKDCKVFGKACTPSNPMGSCMVSSEGACSAYYKYERD
ncbi:hydrogenase formation protein HypD [Helicobacter sp. 11S02629-2]|uniref:hydrogenase formation protein HypD n=1 Tax=Helicobacter sp. 11S02629-2 TaxID=1476195 RepID=UPI000BA76748|nr:hydrogenase formation protein HypD [Helicobacter sp. 11S02629-2]PAF44103.1 hydrogenase formation protein HypD [Helicobacter sp. 11S02629-2]